MSEFKVKGQELIQKIEELIHEGNVTRIIVKDEKGNTYIDIPVTVGVLGAVFAPIVAAFGALAGMAANYTVEVTRKEDEKKENAE
ncbi:MAG: DUF4342 domain-containing protein [Melioribacteraceae bacterium]